MKQIWIAFDNVSILRGPRLILKNLTFALCQGEITMLRGANGSGKTTFLKLCANLLSPTTGRILRTPQVPLAYLGHTNALKRNLTVEENLLLSLSQLGQKQYLPLADALLNELRMLRLKQIPVGYLSWGQQRRVALIRLLLQPARLWLLDEPVSNLDQTTIGWFEQKLLHHQEAGGAALIASHTWLDIPEIQEVSLDLA
jgi:heme exporter protein A